MYGHVGTNISHIDHKIIEHLLFTVSIALTFWKILAEILKFRKISRIAGIFSNKAAAVRISTSENRKTSINRVESNLWNCDELSVCCQTLLSASQWSSLLKLKWWHLVKPYRGLKVFRNPLLWSWWSLN